MAKSATSKKKGPKQLNLDKPMPRQIEFLKATSRYVAYG